MRLRLWKRKQPSAQTCMQCGNQTYAYVTLTVGNGDSWRNEYICRSCWQSDWDGMLDEVRPKPLQGFRKFAGEA